MELSTAGAMSRAVLTTILIRPEAETGYLNRIGCPMARWRGLNEVRKSFTELDSITKARLSRLNPSFIAHVVPLGILWPLPAVKTHFVLLQVSK